MFRELDFHPVARQQPDPIPLRRSRSMRENFGVVAQFQPVHQAGQFLKHYCLVKTHGPFFVTATQCSK